MGKEYNYEVEISFEVGNDELYNCIYSYYNSYKEALQHYEVLCTFASYADVKITLKDKAKILKEIKLTNGEDKNII